MMANIKDSLFRAGILLIAWSAVTMLVTNLLFCAGVTVHLITLIVSFMIAAAGTAALLKWNIKETVLSSVITAVMFIVMTFMGSLLFDISYDSNTMYKTAIALMAKGWNPMRTHAQDAIDGYFGVHSSWNTAYTGKWISNYANGTWLFETYQYLITGKVNAGISFIWLYMCSTLVIAIRYLKRMGLNGVMSFFAAVFLVCNPVTMAQCSTLYVDGPWMLMLSLVLLMLVYLIRTHYDLHDQEPWLILFLAFIAGSSMKLNAFAYSSVFLIVFYLFMLYDARREMTRSAWLKISCFCWLCAGFTVFGTGLSIYGKNIFWYGNLFYGFFGSGAEDIIAAGQIVPAFTDMPTWKSFLISMFAESSGSIRSDVMMKLPFTVKADEINAFLSPDVRVGGFGPWFSGIFIISMALIAANLNRLSKRYRTALLLFLGLSFLMACVLPGSYWLRYVAFIYFIAVIAYALCKNRIVRIVFGILLAVNTAMCSYGSMTKMLNTLMYRDHIRQVSELPSKNVYVAYTQTGGLIDLEDYGIEYQIVETAEEADFVCPTYLTRPVE